MPQYLRLLRLAFSDPGCSHVLRAASFRFSLGLALHSVCVFPNLDMSFAVMNSTAMGLLAGCWWGQGSGARAFVDVSSPVPWFLSVWVAGLHQGRLDVYTVVRVTPTPPSV